MKHYQQISIICNYTVLIDYNIEIDYKFEDMNIFSQRIAPLFL